MTGFDVYEWFDPERGRTRYAPAGRTEEHPLYALTVKAIQAVGVPRVRAVFQAYGVSSMARLHPRHIPTVLAELAALIP